MGNYAAATAFASLGAICWSVQLIPQIYMNHKRRCTEGFSGLMMMLWVSAGVPLGIYNVVQDLNIGLQIQPQLFMFFALICTVQTYHYRLEWSYLKSFLIILCIGVFMAGIEVAGIELLRLGIRNGVRWPITLVGVISAVLINIGLVPQYWEIYKRNAVIGVSYAFLSIDCAGAVFSFISLPFDEWDILAAISYGLLIVEEVGIFVLGISFWLRDRKQSSGSMEKGDGTTQDEITVVERDSRDKSAENSTEKKRISKESNRGIIGASAPHVSDNV